MMYNIPCYQINSSGNDLNISLGVSTVETNRDRDRERPSRRDQFLKLVEIFSTVETDFFLVSRSRKFQPIDIQTNDLL
jgi:hypothetical protein